MNAARPTNSKQLQAAHHKFHLPSVPINGHEPSSLQSSQMSSLQCYKCCCVIGPGMIHPETQRYGQSTKEILYSPCHQRRSVPRVHRRHYHLFHRHYCSHSTGGLWCPNRRMMFHFCCVLAPFPQHRIYLRTTLLRRQCPVPQS